MPYRMILAFLLLTSISAYGQDTPGRYLPDGRWQPRNMQAALPEPSPGMVARENLPDNREEILLIDWGPEIRLTWEPINAFYSAIAESPNGYVHAVTSSYVETPCYARSTDMGLTWGTTIDTLGPFASFFNLFVDQNYVIFPYNGSGIFRCVFSSDYGDTWSDWRHVYIQGHDASSAMTNNILYTVFGIDIHVVECYSSTNHGLDWQYHSRPYQYDVMRLALGGTSTALHLLVEPLRQEVSYTRFLFADQIWSPTISISDSVGNNSIDPKIAAWGDSNVAAIWLDYKYSPYPWTGDILIRRSTDNGDTWLPEQQVTFNHLAFNKNICVSGDSLFLVYDEIVFDGETNTEEIFFNLSPDGGATWGEPFRLTHAPYRSILPSVAVRDNRVHAAWCDTRDDTSQYPGYINSLYYKRGLISPERISWDDEDKMPEHVSLAAYPNPFNSSTTITINNSKGGDIRLIIYDIQGREIRTFKGVSMGGDKKIVWDATDASGKKVSSGLYFARASTPSTDPSDQSQKTIKLLYLK